MTIPLPVRFARDLLLRRNERVHGTHAVALFWTSFDASERDYAVIDDDTDLRVWHRRASKHCTRQTTNITNDHAELTLKLYICCERCYLRRLEGAIWRYMVSGEGSGRRKVRKIQRSDDVQHHYFMCCVYVKTLVKWECDRVVQSGVCRGVVNSDRCVRETRNKFVDISDTLRTCDGRAKCTVVPR